MQRFTAHNSICWFTKNDVAIALKVNYQQQQQNPRAKKKDSDIQPQSKIVDIQVFELCAL